MIIFSLAFLCGDLLLQSLQQLPPENLLLLIAIWAVILFVAAQRSIYPLILSGVLAGFFWSGEWAHYKTAWQLPHSLEGVPLQVEGTINSLPSEGEFGQQFIFDTVKIIYRDHHIGVNGQFRLTWKTEKYLRAGDYYRFHARLKRIHGTRNPDSFDYEAWAIQNNLRATGVVNNRLPPEFIRHLTFYAPVTQVRQSLKRRIQRYLPSSETSPWLLALMIGERSTVKQDHWEVLRATGTNHLMAIAGLHIGLISGFVFTIVNVLWRRSRLLVIVFPARIASALGSLLTAWAYSALAGFSVPTQRACIMLTFFILAIIVKRKLPPWQAWGGALIAVLLINPLSLLSESFWLSFGTIALIIYGMNGRYSPAGLWWRWGRVQWVIGIGLIPLSLLFFQQASLVSVIANSIAIPWLGFLILPFCLLSIIFLNIYAPLGAAFLWCADLSLKVLWVMLAWFAHLDFAVWTQAVSSKWILISSIIGCLLLLLPIGVPGRYLGIIWLLPLLTFHMPAPEINNFRVTILDVGQGLAVIVQTSKHNLIFDAGPKFGNKMDAGENTILPFLHHAGIQYINAMVISHGDNDHIGGSSAVMRRIRVNEVLTSAVDKFQTGIAKACFAGQRWIWDGVTFEIVYPYSEVMQLGNDSSCVLRITNGRYSVLLTGDIEKFAENQLLQHHSNLKADIMTAPHHGSKTSSQSSFITAVQPRYVVFATGYRNRYHFPHAPVLQNYQQSGVTMLNTVVSGAIEFELNARNDKPKIKQYRLENNRYWHDRA